MFDNNERKKTIFFIVSILLAMALSYIFFPIGHTRVPSLQFGQNLNNNTGSNESSLATKKQRIQQDNPGLSYVIDAQYPSIINLGDEQTQNELNQEIQDYISSKTIDFQNKAEKMGIIKNKKSNLSIDYSVLLLNKALLSLRFSVFEDWANVDYLNNYTLTFNYDMANKNVINIDNIFMPGSDYLKVLSDKTRTELMDSMPGAHGVSGLESNQIGDWIKERTAPSANNFEVFTFDDKDLIFYFDPNKTDFYTLGTQTVMVPYKSINNYLDKTSPLFSLANNTN